MAVQNSETPPIIIKKVVAHGGHHGGAWKVAYADFVTAMMALFIVLWLMNSNEKVKKAVAGYFQDPTGKTSGQGSGVSGTGEDLRIGKDDMSRLKEKLETAMEKAPELAKLKDQVQMTVTGEGLRIELLESDVGTFFESGNAQPSASGREMLKMLAGELGKLQNRLLLEGHTDARPFTSNAFYSNWELSADRANAARRLMQESGLAGGQVAQVRGFADQRLRKPDAPDDASNRRVSIIVKYPRPDDEDEKVEVGKAGDMHAEGGHAPGKLVSPAAKPAGPAPAKPSAMNSTKPPAAAPSRPVTAEIARQHR